MTAFTAPGLKLDTGARLIAPLAIGGQGEVWSAWLNERRVAVKIGQPVAIAEEADRLRAITSRHVVQLLASSPLGPVPHLVLELVQGVTLGALARAHAPLPASIACALIEQACAGVEAIHQARLVHRDLSPRNVLVDRRGRVVVIDLGYACPPGPQAHTAGTYSAMSPEQAQGGPVDARTDVFALGCLLALLLTGEHPWRRPGERQWQTLARIATGDPHPTTAPGPPAWAADDAMGIDPAHRPPTPGALARLLAATHPTVRRPLLAALARAC